MFEHVSAGLYVYIVYNCMLICIVFHFVIIVAYILNKGHTVNCSCAKVVIEPLFKAMKLKLLNFKDAEAIAAYMLCDCVLNSMCCVDVVMVCIYIWFDQVIHLLAVTYKVMIGDCAGLARRIPDKLLNALANKERITLLDFLGNVLKKA